MKTLFLVTSALSPSYGVFSVFDRYQQTLGTIKSIREKVPEAKILLIDISVKELPDHMKSDIMKSVDYFLDVSQHPGMRQLSLARAQSPAETLMTLIFLEVYKDKFKVEDFDRIFKITGRIELDDGFDLTDYDGLDGKYVFAKSVPTWMQSPYKGATHVYNTRLYSFSTSLIDPFMEVLKKMFDYYPHVDFEHAMYANLPKEQVVEFERVFCKGHVASSGELKHD